MLPKRRLLTAAGLVAALLGVLAFAGGITVARLSGSKTSGGLAFTSGTVVVGLGAGTAVQCNVSNLVPGDASTGYPSGTGVANQTSNQCRYFVKYTGTVHAYIALDVAITNGTTKLYDSTATGLQLLVRDTAGTTYVGASAGHGGTHYTAQGGSSFAATLGSPGSATDLLVSTSPQSGTFTDEFTVDYNLAIPSSNTNIGGTSTATLTFHAVQSGNNALPVACTAAAIACTGLLWG